MSRKHVVVVGGSCNGMAVALALAKRGHQVTILEKDALPDCDSPIEAFEKWDRRGAPQVMHSHAFLARMHNSIAEHAPEFYRDLMAAGATRMCFTEMVSSVFPDADFIPSDDEIVLLACRRMTYDWVLKRHLERATDTIYRDRTEVVGLEATPDDATGLLRVTGVRVRRPDEAREVLAADLVIDASGRRTKLRKWLREIGAGELEEEVTDCGIFYSSRFYRLLEGVEPPPMNGHIGADLGYMKYAIFPGDSRIFSVTLAASPEDDDLRRILRSEKAFDAATLALPATRAWVSSTVSEPITGVFGFGDLKDTLRTFVRDDAPLVLGLFPIGDSLVHANPLTGRGCCLGWLEALHLADALEKNLDDPKAFALALHATLVEDLVPWYVNIRDQDRDLIEAREIERSGGDPFAFRRDDGSTDPKAFIRSLFRDGLGPALAEDMIVLRKFMRVFNMLDSPESLLRDGGVLFPRILEAWNARERRDPIRLGPMREEMIDQIRRGAA